MCVEVPLDCPSDRDRAKSIMELVVSQAHWAGQTRRPFVCFDRVGAEATFFNVHAWIADRTEEPLYRGRLLDELVDALEACGISVGQTTNLSIDTGSSGASAGASPAATTFAVASLPIS